MEDGKTIDSIFTPEGNETFTKVADELKQVDGVQGVISPLTALEFSATLVKAPEGGTVFDAVAAKALTQAQAAAEAAGDTESAEARAADTADDRVAAAGHPAGPADPGQPGVRAVPAVRQPG